MQTTHTNGNGHAHNAAPNLIAIPSGDAPDTAGNIVWWRLSGNVDLPTLSDAWHFAGLDRALLPSPPSFAVALRRALVEVSDARTLVRPSPKGGWALVWEMPDVTGELRHETAFVVSLDKVGRLSFDRREEHETAVAIREHFVRFQQELTPADISPWLCRFMEKISSVALRDTGGVYFVPRFATETLLRATKALSTSTSHQVFRVPALRSEEAVAAITDALTQETTDAMDAIQRNLDTNAAHPEMRGLGKRALNHRISLTEEMEKKLTAYEYVLGAKQAELHARLNELRAKISVAIINADAEDDGN